MLVFGSFIYYSCFYNLIDEAYYDDTGILFKRGEEELRIHYYEIEKLRLRHGRPPKIEVI